MIDGLAHRYGLLPSEVLSRATTQDVYVFDTVNSYREYLSSKEKNNGVAPSSAELAKQVEEWKKNNAK